MKERRVTQFDAVLIVKGYVAKYDVIITWKAPRSELNLAVKKEQWRVLVTSSNSAPLVLVTKTRYVVDGKHKSGQQMIRALTRSYFHKSLQ